MRPLGWYPGEHAPIVERDTFERIQELLKSNTYKRTARRQIAGALLTGLLFDNRGNRMSPSFTIKNGVRYRFYVSSALLKGRKAEAGSVPRVSAPEIEGAVIKAVRAKFVCNGLSSIQCAEQHVGSVTIREGRVMITLKGADDFTAPTIDIPFANRRSSGQIKIDEHRENLLERRPNPLLIRAIVRAHKWLKSLSDGTYDSIEELARALELHPKVVRKGLRLAFLSPAITKDLLAGQRRGVQLLRDLEQAAVLRWAEQSQIVDAAYH